MRCAAAATDQHREAIEHDEAEDDRIEPWARDDPDALLPRKRLPADAAPVAATARVAVSVESSERRIHPFPLESPPRVIGGERRLVLRLRAAKGAAASERSQGGARQLWHLIPSREWRRGASRFVAQRAAPRALEVSPRRYSPVARAPHDGTRRADNCVGGADKIDEIRRGA